MFLRVGKTDRFLPFPAGSLKVWYKNTTNGVFSGTDHPSIFATSFLTEIQ